MKKHLLFLMLFAGSILVFTSCKKDEDATLEGTWKLTKEEYFYYENNALRSSGANYPVRDRDITYFGFSGNQWIRYDGDEEAPAFDANNTFVYTNGKLMFYYGEEPAEEISVKTLSGRTLVLSMEDIDERDGVVEREVNELTFEKR